MSDEEEVAKRLGASVRHLRRLFEEKIGQMPGQIAGANCLNFVRGLIVELPRPKYEMGK